MKIIYASILLFFPLLLGCISENERFKFQLYGEFKGVNTKLLLLSYYDYNGKPTFDTILVSNNRFYANGNINGPTMVSLTGIIKSNSTSDPNYISFFLEPQEIHISLIENKFEQAKIKGSSIQVEYEILNKKIEPIRTKIKTISNKRKILREANRLDNREITKKRIDRLTSEWLIKIEEIKKINLKYIEENPNSYLSTYLLEFYKKEISIDSIKNYYQKLTKKAKSCTYGKRIVEYINLNEQFENTNSSQAYNFKLKDLNGEIISIEKYRGKYVLLDFWASWCAPCREANPNLIKLHMKDNDSGLDIISLSSDYDKNSWIKAIKKDEIGNWTHIYTGKQKSIINNRYKIKHLPTYILIDKKGMIIGKYSNQDNPKSGIETLNEDLKEIFDKNPKEEK